MAISPVPAFPALSDRADGSYNSKAFAWASHMGGVFVSEANALAANLNSIAAGGAYAIPYVIQSSSVTVGGPAGGNFALTPDGTGLLIDTKSAQGVNVAGALLAATAAAGAVRGSVRIVKQNDPSVFLLYNITNSFSPDAGGLFGYFAVSYVSGNGTFGEGSSVMLFFQRAGDKGDKGDNGTSLTPIIHVQSSTAGGPHVAGANIRVLNSVVRNTIAGASLASNRISLPAGTYRIRGHAPTTGVGTHQAYIWNVTNSATLLVGTSQYQDGAPTSRSLIQGEVVLASSIQVELRHWVQSTSGSLGSSAGSGMADVFCELLIEKIA